MIDQILVLSFLEIDRNFQEYVSHITYNKLVVKLAIFETILIQLFLQATAMAVHLLAPPVGSIVLDMCAAPGMKTTQLAAYLKNNVRITFSIILFQYLHLLL